MTLALALRIAQFALLAALGACSVRLPDTADTATPVWPPAPDTARIAFVRTITGPGDMGIGKPLIERLQDIVFGGQAPQLVRPMAVLALGATLYVADPGVQGVHRLDPRSGRYTLVRGPDGVPLPSPVGLAAGEAGEVYVTDSKLGQVHVIAPGASAAQPLPLADAPLQPTGITFDPVNRHLLVVDTARHQLLVYDRAGHLLRRIGQRGEGPGEFNYPTALWRAADGRLLVTDSLNFRIQTLDAAGGFLGGFGHAGDSAGDTPRPKGVATDPDGHIYVVDALLHGVQIFDDTGRFLLPVGQQGRERGEFWLPAGIFISADGYIYVADAYNRRVQVLRYLGGNA